MEQLQALVDQLRDAVHETYPDSARRAQFDAHLATVAMTIEHMHAETPSQGAQEQ